MNRLTYKLDEPIKTLYLNYEYKRIKDYDIDRGNFGRISDDMIFNKLGKLEDIEEEVGIDLITLFKALKNGFYFKYKDKIISSNDYLFQIRANMRGNWVFDIISDNLSLLSIKFKDYGKTWWLKEDLTKEELENEK